MAQLAAGAAPALAAALRSRRTTTAAGRATFDDLRRQLRLGMGPCQGGFCATRAAGLACSEQVDDAERASGLLRLFLKHRWIGIWPILYGQQVRQTALDHWIFAGTLDVEHLPQPEEEIVR